MSAFRKVTTQLTSIEHLTRALRSLGFEPTVHEVPQPMYIYWSGHETYNAHVIVPAEQLRKKFGGTTTWSDMGWIQNPDGTLQLVQNDMDQHSTTQMLHDAHMEYQKSYYTSVLQEQGYGDVTYEVDECGNLRLVAYA